MSLFDRIISNLPEVRGPLEKRLSLKEKIKWTAIILILFFIFSLIPLFGLGQNALQQFEFLSIILGANFGSVMSLGVGPIVTASIVLQLLVGTKILNLDLTQTEGRKRFQGLQKSLSLFFVVFEGAIYVLMGGLTPNPNLPANTYHLLALFLIIQLCIGGILVLFMDEITSKWGIGSGVSLFIAAGVAQQIFIRAFNFLPSPTNPEIAAGVIPSLFQALSWGDLVTAGLSIAALVATVLVFVICVYGQSVKAEIPLSFGRIRGFGLRWPLNFFYTSNIPVILIAALMANIQLFASLLEGKGWPILGTFSNGVPVSGLVFWIHPPDLVGNIIKGSFTSVQLIQSINYLLVMMIGAVIFSVFWVQTAGMDAKSQARNILSSGLQIPGFRRDERILEQILKRYIWPLTIVGGASIGLLSAFADLTGALSRGTGILLMVMIVYNFYENIARQHLEDLHPAVRKVIGR